MANDSLFATSETTMSETSWALFGRRIQVGFRALQLVDLNIEELYQHYASKCGMRRHHDLSIKEKSQRLNYDNIVLYTIPVVIRNIGILYVQSRGRADDSSGRYLVTGCGGGSR